MSETVREPELVVVSTPSGSEITDGAALVERLEVLAQLLRDMGNPQAALYTAAGAQQITRLTAGRDQERTRAETAETALAECRVTARRLNRRATDAEGPLTRRVMNAERDAETLRAAHQEASLRSATNLRRAQLAEAHAQELDSLLATAQREVETLRARLGSLLSNIDSGAE